MLALAPASRSDIGTVLANWLRRHKQTPAMQEQSNFVRAWSRERTLAAGNTMFDGWIDNIRELEAELSLDGADAARLYQAAIDRWGAAADARIVGQYAAATVCPDGTLRIARSPLGAPPLHFRRCGESWAVASLPSAFPPLGYPLELDWDAMADMMAMDLGPGTQMSQFRDVERLPLGTVGILASDSCNLDRWYRRRPMSTAVRLEDKEMVSTTAELLADACKAAQRSADRPVLALSSGLDSAIVADELLRHLEPQQRLDTITFVPQDTGASASMPGAIGNEWAAVERFGAMHPRIDLHRADHSHGGHDHRFRELSAIATDFNPSLAHFGAHHGVWEKAKELGADWLFDAAFGNQTFSADGRWSYAEDFATLRWARMVRNIRERRHDHRPLWRQVLALGVMPHLSRRWRNRIKAIVRPQREDVLEWNSLLSPAARERYRERSAARGSAPAWEGFAFPASRMEAAMRDLAEQDHEHAEITLALELRYGLRYRDVTLYRPLVEYCLSLPTGMFVRNGQHRYLARQLARGRMPEAQRLEQGYGRHGADWHSRMAGRREELLEYVDAIESHPQLSFLLDTDRMRRMLEDFPEGDSADEFDNLPYSQGLARAFLAAQFVGLMEGRNDL